jgi:hypothetical protein
MFTPHVRPGTRNVREICRLIGHAGAKSPRRRSPGQVFPGGPGRGAERGAQTETRKDVRRPGRRPGPGGCRGKFANRSITAGPTQARRVARGGDDSLCARPRSPQSRLGPKTTATGSNDTSRASRHSTIEYSIYFQLPEYFVHVRARPRMAESLIVPHAHEGRKTRGRDLNTRPWGL